MKAYGDKVPALVIGGKAGSFLGEYQAGGIILVLGLSQTRRPIVSNFPCTGMYGGKLYLRSDGRGLRLPEQVDARPAGEGDLAEIGKYVENYCAFSEGSGRRHGCALYGDHAGHEKIPIVRCMF